MSSTVSRAQPRRPSWLLVAVTAIVLFGLLSHAALDALPTWPSATAQAFGRASAPTRPAADRLVNCIAHTSVHAAVPAPIALVIGLVVALDVNRLPVFQPCLSPPTAPPK